MTNFEMYKDEILEILKTGRPFGKLKQNGGNGELVVCSYKCEKCDFNISDGNTTCPAARLKWLYDEYREVDWSKVAIDTPILVKHNLDDEWRHRYFAGLSESDKVTSWVDGKTKWSSLDMHSEDKTIEWKYAKLAEVE